MLKFFWNCLVDSTKMSMTDHEQYINATQQRIVHRLNRSSIYMYAHLVVPHAIEVKEAFVYNWQKNLT